MQLSRRFAATVLVLAVGGGALACSSSSEKSSSDASPSIQSSGAGVAPSSAASEAAGSAAADRSSAPQDLGGLASGQNAGQTPSFAIDAVSAPPGEVGRAVVSTATVTIRADDIAAAKEQAAAAIEAAGGFVYAEQGQFGDNPSATLTLKVPPERFRSTLVGLGKLGTVDRQDVTTDDVTEQVIDLDSRIASAEVSVARVRSFLDRATNVIEISSFESELLRRETDLEQLRGQKRSLDGRIDLATIVLTVQPPVPVAEPATSEPTELPGFLQGLSAGWNVFLAAGTVLLAILGALVPFAPLLAIAAAAVWWARRRTRTAQGTV